MDSTELIFRVTRGFLLQLPVVLVCIGGTISVIIRHRRLGQGAMPALFGSILALIASAGFPIVWAVISIMHDRLQSSSTQGLIAIRYVHSFLWAGALLLIFIGLLRACPRGNT